MFKVTIWYKVPTNDLSYGPQALIPDSIAATFLSKLASRAIFEERTSFHNPDVSVFSNHTDCNDSSVVVGVKFIFRTEITDLSVLYSIIRYEFARTLIQYGVRKPENSIVLAITPASDTYSSNGNWNIEQSDSMLSSWEARLGERPDNLSAFTSFSCSQHILMARSSRLPGLNVSGQSNQNTGISQDIIRGGTIDPSNNPNPDYLQERNNNQNRGSNIPLAPIVGGVLILGVLTALYLNQRPKKEMK